MHQLVTCHPVHHVMRIWQTNVQNNDTTNLVNRSLYLEVQLGAHSTVSSRQNPAFGGYSSGLAKAKRGT